ncbi:MAG: hypothetical protein JKY12_07495 [Sneathiella sp.]|nr:hypothetical protein [Sneathiella sp.]
MASLEHDKQKQAIVKNLIDTCGIHRALHAAKQFGWHDIASQISERLPQDTTAPHH